MACDHIGYGEQLDVDWICVRKSVHSPIEGIMCVYVCLCVSDHVEGRTIVCVWRLLSAWRVFLCLCVLRNRMCVCVCVCEENCVGF